MFNVSTFKSLIKENVGCKSKKFFFKEKRMFIMHAFIPYLKINDHVRKVQWLGGGGGLRIASLSTTVSINKFISMN